jgi:hypothetical protein
MASEGRKLVSKTTDMSEKLEGGFTTHAAPDKKGAVATGSFPRKGLEARDARDELMAEKMQFIDGKQGMSPFGLVTASDADFRWAQKKRETEALANFDAWAGQNFHSNDPALRKWHQEINPSYYEERERLMVERAKLALRIKLLKLRGPKTEEDLITIWGLQTGRIKLDKDWDRVGAYEMTPAEHNKAGSQQRFANGLFNFRRYLTSAERRVGADDPSNPFKTENGDMDGYQNDDLSFRGGKVPDTGRYTNFFDTFIKPAVK